MCVLNCFTVVWGKNRARYVINDIFNSYVNRAVAEVRLASELGTYGLELLSTEEVNFLTTKLEL